MTQTKTAPDTQEGTPIASRELAHRPADATRSLALAAEAWGPEEKKAVAEFLHIEPDDPALVPFLAISAQYGLDPFMREIWLIDTTKRERAENGEWKDGPRTLTPAVGRDGLLKVARRTPEYEGFQAQVVCAKDEFSVAYTGSRDDPQIHHVQRKSGSGSAEEEAAWRGPVIGAWCKVFVRGQIPVYYYAPLREHGRLATNRRGEKYWQGAWSYTSAMILKAAVSYAHRLALGVTGIVPADELNEGGESVIDAEAAAVDEGSAAEEASRFIAGLPLPDDLRTELAEAVVAANAAEPFSWTGAKLTMRLGGQPEAVVRETLAEIREDTERALERKRREEEARARAEAEAEDAQEIVRAADAAPGLRILLDGDPDEIIEVATHGDDAEKVTVIFAQAGPREFAPGAELVVAPAA